MFWYNNDKLRQFAIHPFFLSFFSYVSQILVEYNVQCELQQTAFVQFDKLDLEPKNCVDGSVTK